MAKAVKIDDKKYDKIRKLSSQDSRQIKWHIDRAIENYLKSKKVT